MKSRKIVVCIIYATVIGGPIWAYLDTAAIRAAKDVIANNSTAVREMFAANSRNMDHDLNARGECAKSLPKDGLSRSDGEAHEWRRCMVNAARETKTYLGAVAIGYSFHRWLATHPADSEAHEAVALAISNGWKDLNATDRLKYYKDTDALHDAYEKSKLMTLFGSRVESGATQYQREAEMLNRMELAVVAPELAQKQADRIHDGLAKMAAIHN